MNIQIFGTSKCFDTKKAQRYFKERGIKFQMIDLKEKGMSRGEFDNVARALGGWEALVNPAAKDKQPRLLRIFLCRQILNHLVFLFRFQRCRKHICAANIMNIPLMCHKKCRFPADQFKLHFSRHRYF